MRVMPFSDLSVFHNSILKTELCFNLYCDETYHLDPPISTSSTWSSSATGAFFSGIRFMVL